MTEQIWMKPVRKFQRLNRAILRKALSILFGGDVVDRAISGFWKMEENSGLSMAGVNVLRRQVSDTKTILSRQKPVTCKLNTQHPVAIHSDDHKYPRGTMNDNTRYPRFAARCQRNLPNAATFLDLGCSGGGIVYDFYLRGFDAYGLEGSDYSLLNQRGHWGEIPERLFTCDITKPFLIGEEEIPKKFDIISAWEVMEHISESDLPFLIANISKHLSDGGYFFCSIATYEDLDPVTGAIWHVTIKNREWWVDLFASHGLIVADLDFSTYDFPRGSGNTAVVEYGSIGDWDAQKNPELGFHLILKKK